MSGSRWQAWLKTSLAPSAGSSAAERNFYLGVWSGEDPPTHQDAARQYAAFLERKQPAVFNEAVYTFYTELIRYYPNPDLVAEEDQDSCPWVSATEASGDFVQMVLKWERYAEVFPLVLQLAEKHGLVCFDPQNSNMHLPARPPAG